MSDAKLPAEPSMEEILASIRRILAEDDGAARASRRTGLGDVLDLTEAIDDDGRVRHIEPATLRSEPMGAPSSLGDGRAPAAAPLRADAHDRLLSTRASDAVAASFGRLVDLPRDTRLNEGQVDETLRETLRPLLKAWLDAHLPAIVERLVQNEITRLVGAAGKH
jgi:uncharacterized protein